MREARAFSAGRTASTICARRAASAARSSSKAEVMTVCCSLTWRASSARAAGLRSLMGSVPFSPVLPEVATVATDPVLLTFLASSGLTRWRI
jgi:hypothetical protein